MAFLTIIYRVAGVTLVGVCPCLDRVKKFEISPVDPFLNGVASLVAIDAEHLVRVTLNAHLRVLFRKALVFRQPIDLVALRFWKSP